MRRGGGDELGLGAAGGASPARRPTPGFVDVRRRGEDEEVEDGEGTGEGTGGGPGMRSASRSPLTAPRSATVDSNVPMVVFSRLIGAALGGAALAGAAALDGGADGAPAGGEVRRGGRGGGRRVEGGALIGPGPASDGIAGRDDGGGGGSGRIGGRPNPEGGGIGGSGRAESGAGRDDAGGGVALREECGGGGASAMLRAIMLLPRLTRLADSCVISCRGAGADGGGAGRSPRLFEGRGTDGGGGRGSALMRLGARAVMGSTFRAGVAGCAARDGWSCNNLAGVR